MVLTALEFHLSWEECESRPVQYGKFPGLVVDTVACQLCRHSPEDQEQHMHSCWHQHPLMTKPLRLHNMHTNVAGEGLPVAPMSNQQKMLTVKSSYG